MLLSEIIIENETERNITISKESWNRIQNEIIKTEKNLTKTGLKKFSGIIKLKKDPLNFQKEIRNEW